MTVSSELRDDGIRVVTMAAPPVNALTVQGWFDVAAALDAAGADPATKVVVLRAEGRGFNAGVDIKEMQHTSGFEALLGANRGCYAAFRAVYECAVPVIAAVNGFALGGGCELAMMADFIIASENAKFGQPEINLGVAPGMGGSQRLTRAIGKSKAMEMCLTGRMMGAEEAERSNLVVRVVPHDELLGDALKTAATIASKPPMAAIANKEMVNAAFETSLDQGLIVERRIFQILAASEDKAEGMAAFVEKREGKWKGR